MKNKIVNLLNEKIEFLDQAQIEKLIEIPPKPEMGDFAFPCFQLAKELHKAPPMIASDLAEQIGVPEFLSEVKVQGAYLNFYVNKVDYIKQIVEAASVENYGSSNEGEGKTICIDYSSPNVAKNFHVGHLRTTIIGNSIYKIFSKLGYKVERINHLGDWGTQFGKLIVAYKNWGNKEDIERDGVLALMNIYVKFHEEAEKDDTLNDQARDWFAKMEQGNEEALEIWQWFKDISLKEYMRIYDLLGMGFDSFNGESFYRDKTQNVVEKLQAKNLLKESEGAQIVDLEEYDMAPCLIMKKDGSSIYATRDLAAIMYRNDTYHFDKCIYVTGQEQKLHFAQVFKVIDLLGMDCAKDLIHVPYGLVSLGGAKLATRSGNIIFAEDILHQSIDKVKEIIEEKNPNLTGEEKDEVAKIVGVGAILFNDLFNQRIKDVSFNWDKILNFDGETGPYVQYTYARCASVLRKAEVDKIADEIDYSLITDEQSMNLLKEISRFGDVVKEASEKLEPYIITRYAVSVAQNFNRFYHENKINVEDEQLKMARLKVVSITKYVLKESLSLLGIGCPEQM